MKEKLLLYAKKVVVFFVAVMSLLTLCFTFYKFKYINDNTTVNTLANGFDLLPFGDNVNAEDNYGLIIVYGPSLLSILITSIILIVISIFNIFTKDNKADLTVVGISLIIAIIYMSMGVTYVKFMVSDMQSTSFNFSVSTTSFIPLIIQAILAGIYFILYVLSKSGVTVQIKDKMYAKEQNVFSSTSYIDDLKQLKELFDAQIINQEEFDAKKKEVLGL